MDRTLIVMRNGHCPVGQEDLSPDGVKTVRATAIEILRQNPPDAVIYTYGAAGPTVRSVCDVFGRVGGRHMTPTLTRGRIEERSGLLHGLDDRAKTVLLVTDIGQIASIERAFGDPAAPLPDKGHGVVYATKAQSWRSTSEVQGYARYVREF